MKTDNIRIKRKNSDFLLLGGLYLLIVLFGIFLIGLPFLSFAPSSSTTRVVLLLLGIVCLIGGGVMYGMLLYRGIRPQDALIITNKGFTNKLVGGKEGVYIAWTDVSSIRIFGLSKAPVLGLVLENNEAYLSALDGKNQRESRANIEIGLPALTIAQKEVNVPIQELKNLFSRMIKGAISWENYTTQHKKNDAKQTESVTVESILKQAEELEKAKTEQAESPAPEETEDSAQTAERLPSEEPGDRRNDLFREAKQPSAEEDIFRKVEMKSAQEPIEADAEPLAEAKTQATEEPEEEVVIEIEEEPEAEPVLQTEKTDDLPATKVFPAYSAEQKTDTKEDIIFLDMDDE